MAVVALVILSFLVELGSILRSFFPYISRHLRDWFLAQLSSHSFSTSTSTRMKFSNILNLALAALAAAVPTPTVDENSTPALVKRASITEACNIGYASTNGGTTGGHGGSTTTVSTLAQFTEAADSDTKRVIYVKGTIKGNARIKVKSDKTIVGAFGSKLEGVGLHITAAKNVIVRNLQISKVKEAYGDAINVRDSRNIWIDHVDVSSDLDSGKDYYDGLIDINHGSDWVTVSNSFLHDHVSQF